VNHNQDSSYFGSLAVGTPATAYNVILDTGSSDMWLASSSCRTGCVGVPTYDAAKSSTFQNLSTPFRIQYGSGAATGTLIRDVVQMAGFRVDDQTFALVDAVTPRLLQNPVSGLMGLGFRAIASSEATPFWQTLFQSGSWDEPVMTFYLTRFISSTRAQAQEPGGRFTMGFIDSRLHSGDIEYINIPSGQVGYWMIPMTSKSVVA
jgi:cathepsin D